MIFEEVRKQLADQLCIGEDEIKMESDLVNDLNADSLDLVQMLILMEKKYKIAFTDEEIKTVKTVADVVRFIEENK